MLGWMYSSGTGFVTHTHQAQAGRGCKPRPASAMWEWLKPLPLHIEFH